MMSGGVISGSSTEQLREIKLIRRAFLDVAERVPVPEEIEWFLVYDGGGYRGAVDYLFSRYSTKLVKEYVLSEAYRTQRDRALSKEEMNKILLYVVGSGSEISVNTAKQTLVNIAQKNSTDPDDVMDYMCELLMSRTSSAAENNELSRKFRDACALGDESRAWIFMVDEILKIPDVCHK
jgi:hypothetical protein